MIRNGEQFLLDLIKPAQSTAKNFNELRLMRYFDYKADLDLTKLPCASSTIHLHIINSFYQCYKWVMAPEKDITIEHPPQHYCYDIKGDYLEPLLIDVINRPDELPEPCTCGKCACESCACRYADIPCCVYCKCRGEDCCQNPNNPKNH